MRKAKREIKKRAFTFIIVPHSISKAVITFKLPEWVVYTGLTLLCGFVFLTGSSLIYSSALSRRLVNYNLMRQITDEQRKRIEAFLADTHQLKKTIVELGERDNELRKLLGLKVREMKIASETSPVFFSGTTGEKVEKIAGDLTKASQHLKARRESLSDLLASVNNIRERFAATPSIWPVYGRIVSYFGYRVFPWRGMHTGIDISAWYGAPVRASAAGVVTYAGWRSGYGRTIIIDHGYRLSSLYGHNSRLAVSMGSKVKKGQIIAYTGVSGFATGPHLHYELRRNGVAINPIRYLNLDIFSAARIFNRSGQGGI